MMKKKMHIILGVVFLVGSLGITFLAKEGGVVHKNELLRFWDPATLLQLMFGIMAIVFMSSPSKIKDCAMIINKQVIWVGLLISLGEFIHLPSRRWISGDSPFFHEILIACVSYSLLALFYACIIKIVTATVLSKWEKK